MTNRFFINWSIWIGFWSGVYVYIYLLSPLGSSGVIWMTFVALPIYFNGGAKREEFSNYFVSVIVGALWGLGYLYCIKWSINVGIEPKFATALVVFVLTSVLCGLHFVLPRNLQMGIIPIMFGAISMTFSQGGQKVVPVLCTLIGGLILGLVCNEGTKLLTEKGSWKFFRAKGQLAS
jgi:hypothetical protein